MSIIAGYQGCGKSTLANKNLKYIDLESSNFFIDNKRDEKWYIPYTNIVKYLSQQGYIVFTSTHPEVLQEIQKTNEDIYILYPNINLENKWIEKLEKRYNETNLNKDYKAYMNAKQCFKNSIKTLENICLDKNNKFKKIEINNLDYDLEKLIEINLKGE